MTLPTIFDACAPRPDILADVGDDAGFAARLSAAAGGGGGAWADPARFFADTYPTDGLKTLLAQVFGRLAGAGHAAIFRLDTSFGGGKTHGLIALVHAARGMTNIANAAEFLDPRLLPRGPVRVAAFDGVGADPANGRDMGGGVGARTPWGEIAYALAGREGYERVRESDEKLSAPGEDTVRALLGGAPALILLDELAQYLAKAEPLGGAPGKQLAAFLAALFGAIAAAPRAAVVFTLAIGARGKAADAFASENMFIAAAMAEAASVSARAATLLNPTEEHETVQVLRRRLFQRIDDSAAAPVVEAYRKLWIANRDAVASEALRPETAGRFRAGYPFHPEVLDVLTGKVATLNDFQRVRGMLRLLAAAIAQLWKERPAGAAAIHLHHIDPGNRRIRDEVVSRIGQKAYVPALDNDIAGARGKTALAGRIDAGNRAGQPPCAAWVARTAFMHTLAFNEQLKGVTSERLRYAVLAPGVDIAFVDRAREAFARASAYLDDRPGAPLRFLAEPNLTRVIQREEENVDAGEARKTIDKRVRALYGGAPLDAVFFPGGPHDVPDEAGKSAPKLVVLSWSAAAAGAAPDRAPELAARIHAGKGEDGTGARLFRNALVFAVADAARKEDMRRAAVAHLALGELKRPERLRDLAPHQQEKVRDLEARSGPALANAILQCYRHVFYPSGDRLDPDGPYIAHTAVDAQRPASGAPGAGQERIVAALRELRQLRLPGDNPDSPAYVRDRTPLKTRGEMTARALRDEFRRNPRLPMLVGDDVFIGGVRAGVERGDYIYRRGDFLCGPGEPLRTISVDDESSILTMEYARNAGIWPRPAPPAEPEADDAKSDERKPADRAAKRRRPGEIRDKTPPPPNDIFSVDNKVLGEALARLWEQARAARAGKIRELTVEVYDAGDAFPFLAAVASAAPGAEQTVRLDGGCETPQGSAVHLRFEGPAADAGPARQFLQQQFAAAADKRLQATFVMSFPGGLPMDGGAAQKLTQRLARFANPATVVRATAVAMRTAADAAP